MPELPEVETTRRGLLPHLEGARVTGVAVRQAQLRWPVPEWLPQKLIGNRVRTVERRAKYLIFRCAQGCMLVHLGMSGSLRVLPRDTPPRAHDHVDMLLDGGKLLRYTDPRRFGSILWHEGDATSHPLLAHLGPEPLGPEFTGEYLYRISRGRRAPVKALLMDSRLVAGVGNIYASEALFAAGIRPDRAAGRVALHRYEELARAVREILERSIRLGGTTLRDFTSAEGNPGYFRQTLNVYGREGESCRNCGTPLKAARIAQRGSVYCALCQR